jgi:hypothetical protein
MITAIHEAGHAVGRYLTAHDMGHNTDDAIAYIEVADSDEPRINPDGMILSTLATTYGPMYSRAMMDHLANYPNDDPVEVDVERCIKAGIDVVSWAKAKALIAVFGPAAEAIYTGREIEEVMSSPECANDLAAAYRECTLAGMTRQAATNCIHAAIDDARTKLADQRVWGSVQRLADNLRLQGRLEGKRAAEIIARALQS